MRSTTNFGPRTKRQRTSAMVRLAAAARRSAGYQASTPVLLVLCSPEQQVVLVAGLPLPGLSGVSCGQTQAHPIGGLGQ